MGVPETQHHAQQAENMNASAELRKESVVTLPSVGPYICIVSQEPLGIEEECPFSWESVVC